jgi:hypothetical protein
VSLAYQPMTMVELAGHLSRQPDEKVRWKHVWEFLEEYRWEPADKQAQLLQAEPPTTGDMSGTLYSARWRSISPRSSICRRPSGRGRAS